MTRLVASLSTGVALAVASAAGAQTATTTSVPGTGDATKISSANREANAAYNQLIGAGTPTKTADQGRGPVRSAPVAATAADITVGSAIRDIKGVRIATVAQVDPDGVVVDTGATKIKVPSNGFGKDNEGLLLNVTAAKFAALVAKAQVSH